jgi:hypothetical protein
MICLEREHPKGVGPRRLEQTMCWKCQEIDREIGHYQGLSARTTDEGSVKSLDILIAKLEGKKKEIHADELDSLPKTAPPR